MDNGDGSPLLAKVLRIKSTRVRWHAKQSPLTTFALSVHHLRFLDRENEVTVFAQAQVNTGLEAKYCSQFPGGDYQGSLAHYLVIQPLRTLAIVGRTLQLPWRSSWEDKDNWAAKVELELSQEFLTGELQGWKDKEVALEAVNHKLEIDKQKLESKIARLVVTKQKVEERLGATKGISIVDQFELGFAHALEQITFLHPSLDVSKAGPFNEVVEGGSLVDCFSQVFTALADRWLITSLRSLVPRGSLVDRLSQKRALGKGPPISTKITASVLNVSRPGQTNSSHDRPTLRIQQPIRATQSNDPVWAFNASPSQLNYHEVVGSVCRKESQLMLRTKRLKVVRRDRLACYRTLVDLILSILANRGERSSFDHGDCRGRRIHRIHTFSACSWRYMKRMFREKFFLASKTVTIKKKICGIRQHSGETLHEYLERFNKLCATCPHHQISEKLLIQYFYEGLMMMDQSMIDATSGGALMDKTPAVARHLISNMVGNTQQFGIRGTSDNGVSKRCINCDSSTSQPRMVNEISAVDKLRLENQLTELTSLVRQLVVGQHKPTIAAKVCGICTFVEHPTNMCPTL
ncbi:hypothetical protein CR513_32633, partial [Mucuna pruriens]